MSVTLLARIGAVFLGIGLQSCLAWTLGPEDRGAYAVAVVFSSVLAVVCSAGLDGAAQYSIASGRVTLDRGISALLTLQFVTALAGIALGIAAMQLPLSFFEKAPPSAFLLSVITFPLEMTSAALLLLLGSRREFTVQAAFTFLQMLARLALVLVLVLWAGFGVEGALAANLAAFALGTGANLLFMRGRLGVRWSTPDLALVRDFLGYGARYYLAALGTIINAQVGVIIVASLASAEEVGLFSAAVALVVYVLMLPDVVGAAIHPRIASDPGGRPELAAQAARIVGLLAAGTLAVMTLVARPMVEILLSPSFLPVVPLIPILSLGVAFRAGTKVLVHYFNATDRPGVFSAETVVCVVTNVGLLLVLLPRYGLPGAAWSMTIAYLLSGAVLVAVFRYQSGLGLIESWWPNRADLELAVDGYRRLKKRVAGV